MKRSMFAALLAVCLLAHAPARAEDAPAAKAQTIEIMRNGPRPSGKAPAANFTGSARLDPLLAAHGSSSRISIGNVTFEPGAHSAWHTHPAGQILIVTAGVDWVQQAGSPVGEI